MRPTSRHALRASALATVLFASAPLLAAPPSQDAPAAAPAPAPAPAPADAPAPAAPAEAPLPPAAPPPESAVSASFRPSESASEGRDAPSDSEADAHDPRRGEGVRLALDLGFQRAVHEPVAGYDVGTPTLLPLGADVSFRMSPYALVGVHGYAALASRDDCISVDSCRARAYGFGAHFENVLGRGHSFQPWIRYGMGFEMLYHGGAPLDASGYEYRDAFDFADLRVGGDFIVARGNEKKTTRIGGFLGFTGGILVGDSGVSHTQISPNGPVTTKNLDINGGAGPTPHLWFQMGLRATLDP